MVWRAWIVLAFSAFALATRQDEPPVRRLQEAIRLHQAGRLEEAVEAYRDYLARGEPLPEVWSNLGAAYAGLGNLQEAVKAYREALALAPASVDIQRNLGLAYYKMGELEAAREWFGRVCTARPGDLGAALLLGDVQFRQGEYKKVVETLFPFRDAAATNQALAYLLGTALIRSDRVEEGQLYVDAILRNGDSGAAHLMLAWAHMTAGNLQQAVAEVEKAVALEPSLPGAYSLLGRLLLSLKQPEEAERAFRRELEENPNDFDANFYLGSLLHERGEDEAALPYLEKARLLRPQALEVRYQVAVAYTALDRLEEARRLLEELVAGEPDFIEGHVSLAAVYHRLGLAEAAQREQAIVVRLHEEERHRKKQERREFARPGETAEPDEP
ncbi:MAG: hypothetical protein Kow00109_02680 [Acidobacteriota bacterium]